MRNSLLNFFYSCLKIRGIHFFDIVQFDRLLPNRPRKRSRLKIPRLLRPLLRLTRRHLPPRTKHKRTRWTPRCLGWIASQRPLPGVDVGVETWPLLTDRLSELSAPTWTPYFFWSLSSLLSFAARWDECGILFWAVKACKVKDWTNADSSLSFRSGKKL